MKRNALPPLAVAFVALTVLAGAARVAVFPEVPPNDPDYDRWERGAGGESFYDEQWNLYSFTPRGVNLTTQASGISADQAWKVTTGRRDVVVAVLDSGIRWTDADLVNQFYLNRGELPEPQDANGRSQPGLYDLNGDGVFNVRDYAADRRFGDVNGNGVLDPGDLIATASDGIDQDGNGYVDDISGWDFFEQDNDPFDNVDFGHGTGRSKEAAAEGDNGIGGIGVAPRAALMEVRIGDSFVVDANDFAQGLLFAADTGAQVAAAAVGSVNNSAFARHAAEYARRRGLVLMASAADENSYHHNFPSSYDAAIAVKAIVPDSYVSPLEDLLAPLTFTFFQHSGCANYGARIDVSLPSTHCSSGATGLAAGLGALVVSRARDLVQQGLLSQPLTADEVKQIVTLSADDVYERRSATFDRFYPSKPGWDQYFGYGRVNARRAVDRVMPTTIPPEADLRGPGWFATVDPARTPVVEITGRVAARRAGAYRYLVEYATGLEPLSADFKPIWFSSPLTTPIEGVLARWSIGELLPFASRVPASPDDFTVTLRLRVFDTNGQRGEDRLTMFVHHDPDLHPPSPLALGASGESSPALADLDGDGIAEIVVATADGAVRALRGDLTPLAGWPVFTDLVATVDPAMPGNYLQAPAYRAGLAASAHGAILGAVAVGDVIGSGRPQVIAADLEGKVYAWDASGRRLPGFPVATDPAFSRREDRSPTNVLDRGIAAAPALADLDRDGVLDIVVAAMDQHLYAWKGDGTALPGWPVLVRDLRQPEPRGARIVSSPAVGDLDGDGSLEVVVGTNEIYGLSGRLYAFGSDGALRAGWPVSVPSISPTGPDVLPLVGQGVPSAPALADVDGDGQLEVGVGAVAGVGILFRADGRRFVTLKSGRADFGAGSNAQDGPSLFAITSGSFGDLDGDGQPEFTAGTAGLRAGLTALFGGLRLAFEHHLSAWNPRTGDYLPSFPVRVEDYQFFLNPAIADIDGDGLAEIVTGSGGYLVHAVNHLGREPRGWPKFTGHWLAASPAVGDVDGDGLLEVVANTREGRLFVWDTTAPTHVAGRSTVQWQRFHHDARNTGNFSSPIDVTAQARPLRP